MADSFPKYDVLAKRDTPSWNDRTREVIDHRLSLTVPPDVLSATQLATLRRVVARVVPDPADRPPTTTLAMVVHRIGGDAGDGFRHHKLLGLAECWRRALDAIEAEARERHGKEFAALGDEDADALLRAVQQGDVNAALWGGLPPQLVWSWRIIPDLVSAHWAQPSLWSAMGFGGPASPRGYVRTGLNRRDPWEAVEEGEALTGLPRHRA